MFLPAYRDIAAVMQRTGMQECRERGESQDNADCNGNIAFGYGFNSFCHQQGRGIFRYLVEKASQQWAAAGNGF